MRTTRFLASVILSAFLMLGCYETRQEFSLNPDGSGKVNLEAFFRPEFLSLVEDQTPEEKLIVAVRGLLEESVGVEVWKDVSFKMLDDGRGYFKGTAYFRNVADLKFHNLGNTKVKMAKDEKNSMQFEIEYGREKEKEKPGEKQTVELSDKDVDKELLKAKNGYSKDLRPMLVALLSNMREEMLFHVPGLVQQSSHLKADVNGDIPFVFSGEKFIAAMDQLFADEKLLRREIKSGGDVLKDGPSSADAFQQQAFGIQPPFSAKLSGPFNPLFNYAAEVAAARTNYAAMLKELGFVASIPTSPSADGEGFKSLKIGGVRLVKYSDRKRGVRPFNYDTGYTLSVVAELSGSVISIEKGEVLTALADNGADLLPTNERDRRIDFPKLSGDKTTVIFDIELSLPGDDVRGIKELFGTMTYFVASGFKEVDLGIPEFKPGTKGKEFNAVIGSIGKSDWGEGQALSIKLDVPKEAVKEIKIYNAAGMLVKISGSGVSWEGNQSTFTQICDSKFPARGRIVVSVYEQPQKFEIPFKIENISLLGQPLH